MFPLSAALLLVGCDDGHLRGSVAPSDDGKTYLVVVDNAGSQCGSTKVDGKVWPHPLDRAGLLEPGTHTIVCGGGRIAFDVPEGVVFSFDYWGP